MLSPPIQYPGFDGFLGTRASLSLDLLVCAMLVIVVVLAWSVFQVKYRQRYELHKWVQVCLGSILLVAVVLFEVDIRLHGWEARSAGAIDGEASTAAWRALYIHAFFAITTVILWPVVLIRAMLHFPRPAQPSAHSLSHLRWARLAAADLVMTAITGWIFYWVAFVSA